MSEEKKCCRNVTDYLVCTCMGVMYSEICDAIDRGCKDFEALKRELQVGTGCSNCRGEIEEILAEKAKKQ